MSLMPTNIYQKPVSLMPTNIYQKPVSLMPTNIYQHAIQPVTLLIIIYNDQSLRGGALIGVLALPPGRPPDR